MTSVQLSAFLGFAITCGQIHAQNNNTRIFETSNVASNNGLYEKEHIGNRRPIAYTYLRESDVMWEKRIWREIDLREKQNQPLYFPLEYSPTRSSLIQVLTQQIANGSIVAFKDEEFMAPYTLNEIRNKLVKRDTIDQFVYTPNGEENAVRVPIVDSTSIYSRVLKYTLKEDWFFDRQKSSLEVRIIGLAAYEYIEEKESFRELFWVYFPSCRSYFAANDLYNLKNDAERRSFDDVFWKRQFTSRVIKESNVFDRNIDEYAKGIDALLESDKIKMNIFNFEHDLWNH